MTKPENTSTCYSEGNKNMETWQKTLIMLKSNPKTKQELFDFILDLFDNELRNYFKEVLKDERDNIFTG